MRSAFLLLGYTFACMLGCSSAEITTSPDGAVTDTSVGDSATGTGCVKAGGMCGCGGGGCQPGYHPAPRPLLDDCPQPCPTCGGCSQQCCLKDEDAGSDASDAADGG